MFVPRADMSPALAIPVLPVGLALVATLVGVVESVMARLRLTRVPQLLVGAGSLALFAVILLLR